MEFPEARGRTVERVELSADFGFPGISIRFQDNTDLTFVIDPALTFQADYSEWKAGNQKILKRWAGVPQRCDMTTKINPPGKLELWKAAGMCTEAARANVRGSSLTAAAGKSRSSGPLL